MQNLRNKANPVKSLLDNDLYKFSLQNFILEKFPDAHAEYRFVNRGKQRFNQNFVDDLNSVIQNRFPNLATTEDQIKWFRNKCPYLKIWYFDYLKNYRFDPKEVQISLTEDNNLQVVIKGPWHRTVLWEVPLMAAISELYFQQVEPEFINWTMRGQYEKALEKVLFLEKLGAKYAEFGTRRRRSFDAQNIFINVAKQYKETFVGTSNVHFASYYDLTPIGTFPHELVMGCAVLGSMNHANRYAMNAWSQVFEGNLGIALADTFTTDAFLKDFDLPLAKLFDGTRQDSGVPITYATKLIDHYKKLKIDPMTKTIVFSDNLNLKTIEEIHNFCKGKIKCSFGVGTFFSSDFEGSPPLNIVIKLWSINGEPCVKLSDVQGKENGEIEYVDLYKKIYGLI